MPIRLKCRTSGKVVWANPTPSSPRFCRPIRFRFEKESVEITQEEINYVQSKIDSLSNTVITLAKTYTVKHTLLLTMIDAKVCNAATSTKSTMRCYLCGQTSSEFNNLNYVNAIDTHALKFGLSPLHLRIRLFENLLHISYKLPIKCWQARGVEAKQAVKDREKKFKNASEQKWALLLMFRKLDLVTQMMAIPAEDYLKA